jgi:hypothetical protein
MKALLVPPAALLAVLALAACHSEEEEENRGRARGDGPAKHRTLLRPRPRSGFVRGLTYPERQREREERGRAAQDKQEGASDPGQSTTDSGGRQGEEQPSQPAPKVDNSGRLERYLRQEFGPGAKREATWYDDIVDVSAANATSTIRTDLADDATGRRLANEICASVIGSLPGVTDIVRVRGRPGGKTLAKCVP